MNKKLIGLDLDGTVLNSQKQVTERTGNAIAQAARQGIQIAYITGRPLSGISQELREIEGVRYAITSNGAVTYDLWEGTVLRGRFISKPIAKKILEIPMERELLHNVFIGGYGYSSKEYYGRIMEYYKGKILYDYVESSRKWTEDIFSFIDETPEGVENIWIHTTSEPERLEILRQLAEYSDLQIVTTMGTDIEIGHRASDKGLAFLDLVDQLGISRQHTLAIGDDANDLGMLRAAGTSVAMGNAIDSVKSVCRYVTADNDHDGVAGVLEQLSLNFCTLHRHRGQIPETVREHYGVLEHHAGDCIQCGACEKRCPFGVGIRENMMQATEVFGY